MAVTETNPSTNGSATGLAGVLGAQRRAFEAHGAPRAEERKADLTTLLRLVLDNRKAIARACQEDFGARSTHESEIAEVIASAHAIRYARRHVAKWMKPRRRATGIWFWPAPNRIVPQPKGVVGIMVPWNFPVNLAVAPLASALAAGNRAMIKTSELTPATGDLLQNLVAQRFAPEHVTVIGGDVEVAREFASLPFDHLLFTGSTAVGRQIMRAAAE
ncbi:MAG TPA: aldehyde dehydrogenase family protein, partial [Acidimicrobiia bacterium]